jgi:TRAP-type C4-dicarboxylate transport system substrate-binding protein
MLFLKKYAKPSAYRSGFLIQKHEKEYVKKYKSRNHSFYEGSKAASNLKRWFDEKWTNQRGEIGYKKNLMYINQQLE